MYTPTTPSVKSVIRDTQIKLPRFQRKKSWSNKKRFELCISLFKGYPMGTIVTKKDLQENGKVIKWLLDGRQRRDTLQEMQNPETIYLWAKEYLKLKNNMDGTDIRAKFSECMKEYIQYDDDEESETSDVGEFDIEDDYTPTQPMLADINEKTFSSGLEGLADLICAVHPYYGKSSNFTKPFLLSDYGTLRYVKEDDKGRAYVDSSALLSWLRPNIENEDFDIDSITPEIVASWYERPNDAIKSIKNNIKSIKNSLRMIEMVTNMMDNVSIQLIELDESCNSSDARKIFEIINTQGVPLTGAEILSAKPDWNKIVPNPSEKVTSSAIKLYDCLDALFKDVVKWDVCATFTDRLSPKSDFILGDYRKIQYDEDPKQFEKKITFGFKLMAARYCDSIGKDDIDSLPSVIPDWSGNDFENEIQSISSILCNDAPFKRFESYNTSILECLGSTVALNYLTLCIKKWKDLDCPTSNGKNYREFTLATRSLFDRFVYEYSSNLWKGSSDSRLNRNLTEGYQTIFDPIENSKWQSLIEEAFENNTINGQKTSTTSLKALTYYFTMLRGVKFNLDKEETLHIDHIIPASKFAPQYDSKFKDSLYNYALLPPELNKRKSDSTLDKLDITDYTDVCDYESLDTKTAKELKTPEDIPKLKEMRKDIVKKIEELRTQFIHGTGDWIVK